MSDGNENGTLPPQLVNSDAIKEYIPTLFIAAKTRWLKAYEILQILQNYQVCDITIASKALEKPPSGSLILFDKSKTKFRKDGINWKKKKGGKGIQENHEKLKIGGIRVIKCCYTHSADDENFHRRCYNLLNTKNEGESESKIVLVHYLKSSNQSKNKRKSIIEGSETEQNNKQIFNNEELTPTSSPGEMNTSQNEARTHTPETPTNRIANNDTNACPSITSVHNNIQMGGNTNSLHNYQPNIESTPINIQQLLQTPTPSITSPHPNNEPAIPTMLDFTDRLLHLNWNSSETMEIDLSSINNLQKSKLSNETPITDYYANTIEIEDSNPTPVDPQIFDYISAAMDLGNAGVWDVKPNPQFVSENLPVDLLDFSPNWDWMFGGSTVLFIFSKPLLTSARYSALFGSIPVEAELISPTVLRCKAPMHSPGVLPLTITSSSFDSPLFHPVPFEYKQKQEVNQNKPLQEIDFKRKLIERLESIERSINPPCTVPSTPGIPFTPFPVSSSSPSLDEISQLNFQNIFHFPIPPGQSESSSSIASHITRNGSNRSIPFYYDLPDENNMTLMHLGCALGFECFVEFLLQKGASVEIYDEFGKTALHYIALCQRKNLIHSLIKHLGIEKVSKLLCIRHPDRPSVIEICSASFRDEILKVLLYYSSISSFAVDADSGDDKGMDDDEKNQMELSKPSEFQSYPLSLAATMIQAVYRYSKYRRQYQKQKHAALVIQRTFRRYNAQKIGVRRKAAKKIVEAWRLAKVRKTTS